MSAIPSPALALARAFDRFERSSVRALNANGDSAELADALVEQIGAKHQAQAALAQVRFADEMWKALLEIGSARR